MRSSLTEETDRGRECERERERERRVCYSGNRQRERESPAEGARGNFTGGLSLRIVEEEIAFERCML